MWISQVFALKFKDVPCGEKIQNNSWKIPQVLFNMNHSWFQTIFQIIFCLSVCAHWGERCWPCRTEYLLPISARHMMKFLLSLRHKPCIWQKDINKGKEASAGRRKINILEQLKGFSTYLLEVLKRWGWYVYQKCDNIERFHFTFRKYWKKHSSSTKGKRKKIRCLQNSFLEEYAIELTKQYQILVMD